MLNTLCCILVVFSYEMILDCTQHDPEDRPDFIQIRDRMVCWEGGRGGRRRGEVGREEDGLEKEKWEEGRKSGGEKVAPLYKTWLFAHM